MLQTHELLLRDIVTPRRWAVADATDVVLPRVWGEENVVVDCCFLAPHSITLIV